MIGFIKKVIQKKYKNKILYIYINDRFQKKIEIETNSPDIGSRKITGLDDYHEKIAWWNSLQGEQQQEWLKIFISNTQFIPIPKITRSSLKNKNFKNEDLPKLYEISPPPLERSQKIGSNHHHILIMQRMNS